jgi:hypothetical protein
LLGWKRDEWRKQAAEVSLVPPETNENDDEDENWDNGPEQIKAEKVW